MKLFDDRLDFLYETVYYFGSNTNRRSILRSDGYSPRGTYHHPNGNKCSIGRHMFLNKPILHLRGSLENLILDDRIKVELSDYLPAKIINLGVNFLTAVSNLHDVNSFWNEEVGLTYTGQNYFNKIISTYCSKDISIDYEREYLHR